MRFAEHNNSLCLRVAFFRTFPLGVSVTFYGSVIKELHAATARETKTLLMNAADCPKIVNIYG